ncbi:flavin reductase [Micromonospora sp. L32]|uniref:flavin reductase n=1 Tax=Micromonospora TaxID=1873 RepID=UPI003F891AB8
MIEQATRHIPLRPMWLCRVDAHPWPCASAKLDLLDAYADDRHGLRHHLSELKDEAEDDIAQLDSGNRPQLADRFLSWVRPRG